MLHGASEPPARPPAMIGPATIRPATIGLILAGGRAQRMGGADKALLDLGRRPLLAHIQGRLEPQCTRLLLNANGPAERFAGFGLPVLSDDLPDYPGPLAGILAGLDWIAAHAPDIIWMVSVAADTPFIPPDYVARLHAGRSAAGTMLACAASGGQTHPVNGLWRVDLRHDLRHALTVADIRKIGRWTARHGCCAVTWDLSPADPFFNINSPADLAEAARQIAADPAVAENPPPVCTSRVT